MTNLEVQNPRQFFPDPVTSIAAPGVEVRLSLWFLSMNGEQPTRRFVHGNVLRTRSIRPDGGWYRSDVAKLGGKDRLLRYSIDLNEEQLKRVSELLGAGTSMSEAFEQADLIHEDFTDSDLASTILERLPIVYFSGAPHLSGVPSHLEPRTSPVSNIGCFCARFSPLDRFKFLPKDPDRAEELLRTLCTELLSETGLYFDKSAGDGFGSLELYYFPSLDGSERPRVEARYENPPGRTLHLRVHPDEDDASFAVQIRSEQVRDIASDDLHLLESGRTELAIDLPEPLDGVLIRVWKKSGTTAWQLWHEQEAHFLRAVGFHMSLGGLSGSVGASWLDKLPTKLSSRVEKFKQISQVSMDVPSETSTREKWETGIQQARQLVAELHPTPSKARFFQRGWGSDENKFEFAEWLKEKLSSSGGAIVLADPYFDLLGLDLICRASGAAKELVIATCTQVPSEDDTSSGTRAERLRKAALQYLPIVSGLNLRICDLRSPNSDSRTKPLFHDRYLLLFDAKGNPTEGYNLSTSLQSAATTSPLLVTEIANDILPDVADYVSGLLSPGTEDAHVVEKIFPTTELKPRARRELTDARAEAILAAVEAAGRSIGSRTAVDQLKALNLVQEEKVKIVFDDEELSRIVAFLGTADLSIGTKVWDGVVEAAVSGWHDGVPDLISRLNQHEDHTALHSFLIKYLKGHASGELSNEDSSTYVRTLAQSLAAPFERAIGEAGRFYDHHHQFPLGTSWGIRLALIALIQGGPERIDELIGWIRKEKAKADATYSKLGGPKKEKPNREEFEAASKVAVNADAMLSAIVSALTWFAQPIGPGLQDAYANCAEPFIRALWAVAHVRTGTEPESEGDPSVLLAKLGLLNPAERRLVLGQAVGDLRVRAKQKQARGVEPDKLPDWLTIAVANEAAAPSTVEELVRLIDFYSGPLLGNWATSTHDELIAPLVDLGKLAKENLFDVWDRTLKSRMADKYATRSDFQLLQVWGICSWFTSDERRAKLLAADAKALDRARHTLEEPLLSSRNHDRWWSAVTIILWTLLRSWAIERARPGDKVEGLPKALLDDCCRLAVEEHLVAEALGEMKAMVEYVVDDLQND